MKSLQHLTALFFAFSIAITTTQAQNDSIEAPKPPIFETIPQTPKEDVLALLKNWYENHPKDYALNITGEEVITKLDNYHRDATSKDLLRVHWKGMVVTLSFNTDLRKIKLTPANLQKHFNYVVLDKIYHDVEFEGWELYPRTPQSSSSKGVKFSKTKDGKLSINIDWQIYTFFGYSQTPLCKMRMQITDTPTPIDCYVGYDKRLPLHLHIECDEL